MMLISTFTLLFATAFADTYNVKKCLCTSQSEVAQITSYNWTDTNSGTSYAWDVKLNVTRDNDLCPEPWPIQCSSPHPAREDCWDIPKFACYKNLTAYAGPPWASKIRHNCVDVIGKHICGAVDGLEVDRKNARLPEMFRKTRKGNVIMDCSAECEATWPGQGFRSACSKRNVNPKSKHYGQDVSGGYAWSGRRLITSDYQTAGMPTGSCVEWNKEFRHKFCTKRVKCGDA
jgi:hypothetical protein